MIDPQPSVDVDMNSYLSTVLSNFSLISRKGAFPKRMPSNDLSTTNKLLAV